MASSRAFSVPASVMLNRRLISQRGGISPQMSEAAEFLRFELFINSNPSSVRYGLTLQISASRDMSKEHNVDQIHHHSTYIFFPTSSFLHYRVVMPSRGRIQRTDLEGIQINEEELLEATRASRMFWVKRDTNFAALRLLIVKCTRAVLVSDTIPKLRNEALEWELKRIFGTIKTANELEEACLEIEFLIPAMNGETDRALAVMHTVAVKEKIDSEMKNIAAEAKQTLPGQEPRTAGHMIPSNSRSSLAKERFVSKNTSESTEAEGDGDEKPAAEGRCKDNTPKKPFIPAIIDGKFVSPDKIPLFRDQNRPTNDRFNQNNLKTSPQIYLHPHTFDSVKSKRIRNNGCVMLSPGSPTADESPECIHPKCHQDQGISQAREAELGQP